MKINLTALTLTAALLGACATATVSRADQPRMQAALQNLQEAKRQLQLATHDKGGHRAEAIEAVDRAIRQVERGIEYDRQALSPNENRR
jgi:hypothetical protein